MKPAIQEFITNLESLGEKITAVLKPDGSIDGVLIIFPRGGYRKRSEKKMLNTYRMRGRDFTEEELGASLVETGRIEKH